MSWIINTDSTTGMMKFSLSDDDGDLVASFRVNPSDPKMISRMENACAEARNMSNNAPEVATGTDIERYCDKLEDLICKAICVKREAVFAILSGATILPDGDLYAVHVLSTVADSLSAEISSRKGKMQRAAEKYTAKYQ